MFFEEILHKRWGRDLNPRVPKHTGLANLSVLNPELRRRPFKASRPQAAYKLGYPSLLYFLFF